MRLAHADSGDCTLHAQRLLLQRYCGAAYRYLRGALRDEDAALELLHELVVRFLRGDFHQANPSSGRFRDYLKMALIHLVTDYYREQKSRPSPLPGDIDQHAASLDNGADHEIFLSTLR